VGVSFFVRHFLPPNPRGRRLASLSDISEHPEPVSPTPSPALSKPFALAEFPNRPPPDRREAYFSVLRCQFVREAHFLKFFQVFFSQGKLSLAALNLRRVPGPISAAVPPRLEVLIDRGH
jgi:hypothetical protein